MDLASFIATYGYVAVLVGTLVEGETLVVLAGLAAQRGYLSLPAVIAVATLGSIVSYQFCFQMGRRVGPRLLAGIPNSRAGADRVRALAERHPALIIIGIHFLYGIRTVGLFVIGMSGVKGWKFFYLNVIGSIIWASIVAVAGYLFGNIITAALGDFERYDQYVFTGIALAAVIAWLVLRYRRRSPGA